MTCDVTGLTDAEKSTIRDSWQLLSSKKKDNGMALFMTLFSSYPQSLHYFHEFDGKSIEELQGMSDMRAHATAVMYAMDSLVDNLTDPHCMLGLIKKISRNHKARNIGKKDFEELRALFGGYLDKQLGDQATSGIKAAWDKFLTVLNNQIEKDQA
ncbi:hypothetical protein LOTGIDRAFT_231954 [Lottia gigantea]|uniref:Globin n=1 Tax=Lottia gigantea TaxID=225164 RepID=V4ALZ1_LOTGI|nr:hypothetical protein LOTGIDRAFT_231954 [Lottia gigantea]ESO95780.1 hypothetical protein LOTGIDRAFT_231954 [Lottia gigantea]